MDDAYIPLALETPTSTNGSYDAESLPEAGTRVIVVGDPGSGKSSLAKAAHRHLCKLATAKPRKQRLPIIIQIKELSLPRNSEHAASAEWLLNMIRERVSSVRGYDMARFFDTYLANNGLIVIMDGLDEVPSQAFRDVITSIRGLSAALARRSPDSILVLTSRAQFHQQVRHELDDYFPVVLQLRPFAPSDVYEFLSRWDFGGDRHQQIAKVYKQLTDSPALYDLCTNPLILSMYLAGGHSREGFIPDTRTRFYSRVMEELLGARRARQEGGSARAALKEHRESVLGAIALDNLTDDTVPANWIDWARAVEIVADVMRCPPAVAEETISEVIKDTGLISEQRPRETLCFNHLTFCEFLAAAESVQGKKGGWFELTNRLTASGSARPAHLQSRVLEVIPFACALAPRVDRPSRLADIAHIGDSVLLGRCLLETQSYKHGAFDAYVDNEAQFLCGAPEASWDGDWFRRLQLFGRVLRDSAEESRPGTGLNSTLSPMEFYQALIGDSTDRLLRVFSEFAEQDAAAALRLADDLGVNMVDVAPSTVIANLDKPAFFAMAVDRANRDGPDMEAWAVVLSEAGLRYPVVALQLQAIPTSGASEAAVNRIPRRRHWHVARPPLRKRCSLYTDCLTIACDKIARHERGISDDLDFVARVRRVRSPGSHLPAWIPYSLLVPAALLFVFSLVVSVWSTIDPEAFGNASADRAPVDWGGVILTSLILVLFLYVYMSLALFPSYRSAVYSRLLNLRGPHAEGPAQFKKTKLLMSISLVQRCLALRAYAVMSQFERRRVGGLAE